MIEKVLKIDGIGKFTSYSAAGDTTFKKLTLIYAENGTGKTTLSAILRSLASSNNVLIQERATVGSSLLQHVTIRINFANVNYNDGAWTRSFPDIEFFDEDFVRDNIHAGLVTLDHRRNLNQVILGAQGVTLAKEVEELATKIGASNSKIRDLQQGITRLSPVPLQEFLLFCADSDIDKKIGEKERELQGVQSQQTIKGQSSFETLVFPQVDIASLRAFLSLGLEGIGKEVEARVKKHLREIGGADAESWITRGLQLTKGTDDCPFCGQDTSETELLNDFTNYFSETYRGHKEKIAQERTKFDLQGCSLKAITNLTQAVTQLKASRDFWSQFIPDIPEIQIDLAILGDSVLSVRDIVLSKFNEKLGSPLEIISFNDMEISKLRDYIALSESIAMISDSLQRRNGQIENFKVSIGSKSTEQVRLELDSLKAQKIRFTPEGIRLCKELQDEQNNKLSLENQKETAKTKLNNYHLTIFPKYQDQINHYLKVFGADFRITDVAADNSGGKPGTKYQICINNTKIPLGDEKTTGKPCFRNTLSGGDKNALALAFFFARLETDPDLANKIIILDDPVSSFDAHRAAATQQEVCLIAHRVKQLIVLSHSARFLRAIWDSVGKPESKSLEILRYGANSSVIKEWDIEAATEGDFVKLFKTLADYRDYGKGNDRDVATSIRVLLETHLRLLFSDIFRPGEWLGDFVKKAKAAEQDSIPILTPTRLAELDKLKNFAGRFHHSNPNFENEPIIKTELNSWATRTLEWLRA